MGISNDTFSFDCVPTKLLYFCLPSFRSALTGLEQGYQMRAQDDGICEGRSWLPIGFFFTIIIVDCFLIE